MARLLLLGLFFCLLLPGSAWSQATASIFGVWRGDEPADGTEPGEVCLIRDSDLAQLDTVRRDDTLSPGDQLKAGPCDGSATTFTDDVLLGVQCGDGTELHLAEDFDILIAEPGDVDCHFDLRQGTSDVLTDQPARVTSGGITLGVEGTQFAITREPTADPEESLFVCRLFEGRLRVQRPEKEIQLDGGEVWTWDGRNVARQAVPVADVVSAAKRAARLDTARAWSRGTLTQEPRQAVETLTRDHLEALLKPTDSATRRQLADSLSRLGVDDRAVFERGRIRAQPSPPPPSRRPLPQPQPLVPPPAPAPPPPACVQSTLDSDRATQKIHLPTELGIVILEMPARVAPRDAISGTMTFAASGPDNKERKRLRKLGQFQVAVGDQVLPVREGTWTLRLPAGGSTSIELQSKRGKTQVRRPLTLTGGRAASRAPGDFSPPCSCRAGYPLSIAGPFDGDLRTTRVAVGGRAVKVLAESPREVLVECLSDLAGGRTLAIEEGGIRRDLGDFRVVQLDLQIVPRQIERKKNATATVRLSGLAGQQQAYCLRVHNQDPKIVRMKGGEEQLIPLSPGGWRVGDTRTFVFDLKGKKRGVASVGVELLPHGCPR